MKAIYINDCQYDFIDNHGETVFSFYLNRPITFLDIRKLQLSSMIKGNWCNFEEIALNLSKIHQLDAYELGILVNFFELFKNDSEKLIFYLPDNVWAIISKIQEIPCNSSIFLIDVFEKDEFLASPIEGFCKYARNLKFKNIKTIRDLVNLTRNDLLKIGYIGVARANEIEQLLAQYGLHLKEEQ